MYNIICRKNVKRFVKIDRQLVEAWSSFNHEHISKINELFLSKSFYYVVTPIYQVILK
jgi:hypothetical protein